MQTIQTVTGPMPAHDLGRTLVHEHLVIGYPGWFMDALAPAYIRSDVVAKGVDTLQRLLDHGVRSFVDPCPMDLGRDVELMAEVASRSKMRIICTTGAYKQDEGLTYTFGALPAEDIAAIYIKELTEGIGGTGIRAGLVKVATGAPKATDYELKLLKAAGMAAAEVGCPVITHTDDARLGDVQLDVLAEQGVPAHRVLVGHSDGRDDGDYHLALAQRQAYVGFDRFGIETILPDEQRLDSVCRLLEAGYLENVCLSHDAICASWLGRPVFGGRIVVDPQRLSELLPHWSATHLFERILPALRARGVPEHAIDTLLVDNPTRYFTGTQPPRRSTATGRETG